MQKNSGFNKNRERGGKDMRKIVKNLKIYRLVAWILAITMLAGYVPQGVHLKSFNSLKDMGKVQAETTLQNPRIVKDSSMDAGQKVTWDCVWFGSYPQSEIVKEGSKEEKTLKRVNNIHKVKYDVVNEKSFKEISNAQYNEESDAVINGERYKRLRGIDAVDHNDDEGECYYDWISDYKNYHYFKYEPIKWRILKRTGNQLFVVSDIILENQRYNMDYESITWGKSTIRSWLNGYGSQENKSKINYTNQSFINKAFSANDIKAIQKTNVINDNNIECNTAGGNNTVDKLFLLSEREVYYTSEAQEHGFVKNNQTEDEARKCLCSTYAWAMGAWKEDNKPGNSSWSLRSPGLDGYDAAYVDSDGLVNNDDGGTITTTSMGVRPALHLNLSSTQVYSYAGTVSSDGTIDEVAYDEGRWDDEDYEYKDYTDYDSEISSFMNNKGTRNTIQYLCINENFPNSIYVYKNDATFASNVAMVVSDMMYRGMDGWRDLYDSSTSIEEAEKTLAALVQQYHVEIQNLAEDKTRKKYADVFVAGLHNYIKALAISNNINKKDIKVLESIVTENTVSNLFLKGDYNKLCKYFQEQGGYSENSAIVRALDKYAISKELADGLSKVSDFDGIGITIEGIREDTLNYMCQLEGIIQADAMYSEMLMYIKNNCQFDVVKQAAQNLCDVIQGGWQKQLSYVTTAAKNKVTEEALDLVIKQAVKASPWLELVKGAYDWGVSISNILFNTEDIQKQKDNMRIVAYLGDVLKKWVIDNQTQYLNSVSNGSSIKEKNIRAKKLYYSMYMLWKTRIVGEKTLQKMMKSSYSKRSKYYTYSMQTLDTLEAQNQAIFTSDMMKKIMSISVSCPVDVEVYNKNGKLLLTVKDGKESSGYKDGIYYYVQYHPLDKDYTKTICYPENSGYTLKYVGKSSGRVDSNIMEIKEDGSAKNSFVDNISIKKGSLIFVKQDSKGIYNYKTTDILTGKEKEKSFNINDENNYTSIEKLAFLAANVKLNKGSERLLTLTVLPENATNQKLLWESSDSSIAWVDSDGVVHGKAEGKAKITAYSLADEISASCMVQVVKTADSKNNTNIKVKKINLKGLSTKIAAGKKLKLTVTVTPYNAKNKKLRWSSSNTKVAKVTQSGIVTMIKKSGGKKAVITAVATDGSRVKASWKVTSMKGIVKNIKLTGVKTVKAGKSVKLKATVKATKKANKKLLWTSSNKKYATVNGKGVVKTKKAGKGKKVKITATATDGSGKKSTVTIKIK